MRKKKEQSKFCVGCQNTYPSTLEYFGRGRSKKKLSRLCKVCMANPTPEIWRRGWDAAHQEFLERSVVYFVRCRNLIKIGSTTNIEKRLADHRYAFPHHELHLLGVIQGGLNAERRIQRQFRHLRRYRHEWFKAAPELIEWILTNAKLV